VGHQLGNDALGRTVWWIDTERLKCHGIVSATSSNFISVSMEHRETHSSATITGRIDSQVHDLDDLESHVEGNWNELSDEEKLDAARDVEPVEQQTVYNATTDRFHEYFVDNLDPGQSAAKDNLSADYLAVGTNGGGGTATGNTDLNNRVFSKSVTDHADNTKDLLCSTFIDSTEANGNTIDELGLYTGDPANLANADVFLMNHSTFSAVTKDNSKTVTFDVTLTFSDV